MPTRIPLEGKRFGEWEVLEYVGDRKYLCRCSCGVEKIVKAQSLVMGRSTNCGHASSKAFQDLTGKHFGEWEVLEYLGNSMWKCRCSCGTLRNIGGYALTHGITKSCGHVGKSKPMNDITGQKFGFLTAIEYVGESKWRCQCDCGNETEVLVTHLINGTIKSCGCYRNLPVESLVDQKFGDWTVLEYVGKSVWKCQCSCGEIRNVPADRLKNGRSKSCGHNVTKHELEGKVFGDLTVKKYLGNKLWECECSCGRVIEIETRKLTDGSRKSCGCKSILKREETSLERYGVTSYHPKADRTQEQIELVGNRKNLLELLETFEVKPSISEVSELLGINEANTLKYIHRYNLEDKVTIGATHISKAEKEIYSMFPWGIQSDRSVLKNREIDILFKEENIGIEFNGTYWHNSTMVDKDYHKNKTIDAFKSGVQLIHIFEYEWENEKTKEKIIKILNQRLKYEENNIINANKCTVREISTDEAREFLNENHLQNYANSSIKIGIYHIDELVGVMTLGKPRFTDEYEYELIRLAFKLGTVINGGTEKLFKYFIRNYNPDSIVSYCDISKFNGNSYSKLGFKSIEITEPNYVWVTNHNNEVFSRYKTQKQRLVDLGLGTPEQTEDEIMTELNCYKIFDCGNLKLEWRANNG